MDTPTNPAPSVRDGIEARVGYAGFVDGTFELIVEGMSGKSITLSGKLQPGQSERMAEILPTCVMVPVALASAPVPDQSGVGGNVGEDLGEPASPSGSHPSDQAASHPALAGFDPSRGADEALERRAFNAFNSDAPPELRRLVQDLWSVVCYQEAVLEAPSSGFAAAIPSRGWPASYQETFDAIAAAVTIHDSKSIGISVKAFYRALSYPDSAGTPPAFAAAIPPSGLVTRDAERFARPSPDGRPAMPEGYAAELDNPLIRRAASCDQSPKGQDTEGSLVEDAGAVAGGQTP